MHAPGFAGTPRAAQVVRHGHRAIHRSSTVRCIATQPAIPTTTTEATPTATAITPAWPLTLPARASIALTVATDFTTRINLQVLCKDGHSYPSVRISLQGQRGTVDNTYISKGIHTRCENRITGYVQSDRVDHAKGLEVCDC